MGISIISYLKFLAFPYLERSDEVLFKDFITRIEIMGLTPEEQDILEKCLEIRKGPKLKLPDAIIAATTLLCNAKLLSADRAFSRVDELDAITF